eukprot:TRINITY_DN1065_c0_g2_i8.p1 TRINITY_DN1065_c0_g2~~TRINITY_DN1065_c0_g2_i8.p1  ORF type:complete len:500 (-),score=146.58 TRINITY_DN1065_c0_g2_i8:388-1887(-)
MKRSRSTADEVLQDARFSKVATDARFRNIRKQDTKTRIDERFAGMFKDSKFSTIADVDRYGRPLPDQRSYLDKYYDLSEESQPRKKKLKKGLNLGTASGEVKHDPQDEEKNSSSSSSLPPSPLVSDDEKDEKDEGNEDSRERKSYDDDSSSFTSMSSSEEEEEEEEVEKEEIPVGEVTHRLAILGIDWTIFCANDLWHIFSLFVPAGGLLKDITVYLSDFGSQLLEEEERLGPSILLQDNVGFSEDQKNAAIHRYERSKRRCYFAILTCSDFSTAQALYKELDGHQIESSSYLDLRYVPNEQDFSGRKQLSCCSETPENYHPPVQLMQMDKLSHTKPEFDWDETDKRRLLLTKTKFTKSELNSSDFAAYLASSDSSDSDSEELQVKRDKYRKLLLGQSSDQTGATQKDTFFSDNEDDGGDEDEGDGEGGDDDGEASGSYNSYDYDDDGGSEDGEGSEDGDGSGDDDGIKTGSRPQKNTASDGRYQGHLSYQKCYKDHQK